MLRKIKLKLMEVAKCALGLRLSQRDPDTYTLIFVISKVITLSPMKIPDVVDWDGVPLITCRKISLYISCSQSPEIHFAMFIACLFDLADNHVFWARLPSVRSSSATMVGPGVIKGPDRRVLL